MDRDSIKLSMGDGLTLAESSLQKLGFSTEEAQTIAAHLVDAELMGYSALGLCRILTIAEHPLSRQPRNPIAITYETPVSARVDGGNHVGMFAIRRAADVAIDKARISGFAVVGAHNTYLSGRNAYYLDLIARAGFVGLHLACSPPVVAPLGGVEPAFGTNPIAFGVPKQPHPIIIDIATSAANFGDLLLAERLGRDLPEGVAIDAEGQPTCNPTDALAGAILPFGGHKGYCLSFAAQMLGLLGGASATRGTARDFGFLFVVFDPGLLMPPAEFYSQIDTLVAEVKGTRRRSDVAEIRIPSERAYAERERRVIDGFELPRAILERLERVDGL